MSSSRAKKAQREKKERIKRRKAKERAEREAQEDPAAKAKREELKKRKEGAKKAYTQVVDIDQSFAGNVKSGGLNLWIGNKANAMDKDYVINGMKCTHVLNCALEIEPPDFYEENNITCLHLPMTDKNAFPIEDYMEEATDFLDDVVKSKGTVLVHCQEGKSRSATMCIAYFIKFQGKTLNGALSMLTAKRPLVQPNKGFLGKIRGWEKQVLASTSTDKKAG